MSPLWILAYAAAVALMLVASIARREPIRLPRRVTGPREEGAMRVVHRGIVVHVAMGLACGVAVLTAADLSARGLALFFVSVLLAWALGERIGRMRPGLAHFLAPLLAPVDGAALLLDWIVSPILRRKTKVAAKREDRDPAYEQVVELMERTVEQAMTPRSEVVWLRADATLSEIAETSRRRPHAHYPVFEGDFERLVGMVDLVDLLGEGLEKATAADIARPAVMVPETIGCDDLLERMRNDRFSTAVVVDEFGGIAGLVTLEDLLEVVVGELVGEHETVRVRARKTGEGTYLADAGLRLDEFEDLFNIALPEGDYETLAGLFLSRVFRMPEVGEKVSIDDHKLEVIEADAHRIRLLKIMLPSANDEKNGNAGIDAAERHHRNNSRQKR